MILNLIKEKLFGGDGDRKNKRLAGALDLVSGPELNELVKNSGSGSCLEICGVALPKNALLNGVFIAGSPGSGKSTVIHDLVGQVNNDNQKRLGQKIRMVINDPIGEFWKSHADPSRDIYWNPALLGSANWSIFSDMVYSYDAQKYAYALIPKHEGRGGVGDFFDDVAREVFAAVLLRLAEAGAKNTNELAFKFLYMTDGELMDMTSGLAAKTILSVDVKEMRKVVMGIIGFHIDAMAVMPGGDWSCREWLEGEGNLYLIGDQRQFGGVKRMFLNRLIEMIAERDERIPDVRYLFALDEYGLLGDIGLDRHLTGKSKYGLGFVLSMQSVAQAELMMGKTRAEVMLNDLGTMLALSQIGEAAQNAAAGWFGNQLQLVVEGSHRVVNKQQKELPLVFPADFGTLGAAQGYLKFVGNFPAARIDFSHWGKMGKLEGLTKAINELPKEDQGIFIRAEVNRDGGFL